jgi:rhodanese-related sulfurtransferase
LITHEEPTMSYRSITPDQAAAEMAEGRGVVYLDVRSQREFMAGHPRGAINIPIAENDGSGQMGFNSEFVAVAEKLLPTNTTLVIGCASGKRSEAACRVLEEAGYTDLANIEGGFSGTRDPFGRVAQPGWAQLGLPVSDDSGPGVSYASLREKAGL